MVRCGSSEFRREVWPGLGVRAISVEGMGLGVTGERGAPRPYSWPLQCQEDKLKRRRQQRRQERSER